MLINVMKLYETERNFTGRKAQIPFLWRDKYQKPLFLDLESYYVQGGDLDRNIIQSVWEMADNADDVMRPLAMTLMDALNRDPRTIFRRLKKMREDLDLDLDQNEAETEKS